MLVALIVALVSIALGVLLGLVRGRTLDLAGPVHAFAMVAAVVVVFAQLLPDALSALGFAAIVIFVASAVFPGAVNFVARRFFRREIELGPGCRPVGLELGYAALLVHKVGDGLALGAYSSGIHHGHEHVDVLFALGAHSVPMAALVLLTFRAHLGLKSGFLRTVGLAVATVFGILVAGLVPVEVTGRYEPWITAGVAGLLLHVVTHSFHQPRERTRHSRALDLIAIVAGASILLLGDHGHHGHGGDAHGIRAGIFDSLAELTIETAPTLLIGLLIAAVLQTFGSRLPVRWLSSGSSLRQAIRGAVVGAPLPVCACGILPVAQTLRQKGGPPALVVAFLLSTPELGVETFALTGRFFGWPFAFVRLGAALAVAIVAALFVARVSKGDISGIASAANVSSGDEQGRGVVRRALTSFDELIYHTGPWTLVGLLAAAYTQSVLPEDAFAGGGGLGLDILVVSLLAVPSYVCASSATPLAAVLLAKGLSPGAVLAGLLLGPATNVATIGWLGKSFGRRATVMGIGGLVATTWVFAWGLNAVPLHQLAIEPELLVAHEHGIFSIVATVVLGLLLLRSVTQVGIREWVGSLGEGMLSGPHDEHGHGHHAHGHEHGDGGADRSGSAPPRNAHRPAVEPSAAGAKE